MVLVTGVTLTLGSVSKVEMSLSLLVVEANSASSQLSFLTRREMLCSGHSKLWWLLLVLKLCRTEPPCRMLSRKARCKLSSEAEGMGWLWTMGSLGSGSPLELMEGVGETRWRWRRDLE